MENKGLYIGVALLVVGVFLVPMLASKWNHATGPDPVPAATPVSTPSPMPAPTNPPPARPAVNAAILDKLLYGMTYEQVVGVVGAEADEAESQYERDKTGYTGPTLTVWKTWVNPDGSKLRVGFVESKLEQKQFKRREWAGKADSNGGK